MPSSAGGVRAGLAYVELSLKDGPLTKGLRAWSGKLRAFGASIRAIGTKMFAIGSALKAPFLAAEGVFDSFGSQMARASEQTGVSVEALSQLSYAAKQAGVDFDELTYGFRRFQNKLGEAEQGNGGAIDSFVRLGVSLKDLRGLSPDKQLEVIATKIDSIQDPAKRAAFAIDLFGKSGTRLLPLLDGGGAAIEEMRRKADALGLTMSSRDANAAVSFSQALSTLWAVVKQGSFNIGAALAPALQDLTTKVTGWLSTITKWISKNREIIVSVARVATGIVIAGVAVYTAGTIFGVVASAIGGLATVLSTIGTAFGVVASLISAILTPIGLVVAALAGLGVYFVTTTDVMAQAGDALGAAFSVMKDDATQAFNGIKDAMSAGDFGAAAKILWTTIKLEFNRGIGWLKGKWNDWTSFFQELWTKATFGLASTFTRAWAGLQTAWAETIDFLSDTWTTFTSFITKSWFTAIGFIQKAWIRLKSVFDSDIDYDAEAEKINAETEVKRSGVDQDRDKKISDREVARKRNEKQIGDDEAGMLKQLQAGKQAKLDAIVKQQADGEKELQENIDKLVAERNDLIKHAAGEAGQVRPGVQNNLLNRLKQNQNDGIIDTAKSAVGGTFSARTAGRQLGSHDAQQLAELKKIVAIGRNINKAMPDPEVAAFGA